MHGTAGSGLEQEFLGDRGGNGWFFGYVIALLVISALVVLTLPRTRNKDLTDAAAR